MSKKRIYGLFILVCLIFGSTFLAISIGLDKGASPLFFASLRFIFAGGIMLALLLITKRISKARLLPLIGRSAVLSLFLTVGTFGCMFIAQTRVDSGLMARLDGSGPIITAVLAAVLLGKKLNLRHGIAFVMGSAGIFLMASPATESSQPFFLVMAMVSVVLYSAGNAIYPRLFRQNEDTVAVSALQSFIGGIILLAAALVSEDIAFPSAALPPLLYLIIAGSIIAHTATLVLVKEAGPVFASGWLYAAPVTATILGALVLGEKAGPADAFGTLLALGGVFLLNRAEAKCVKS